MTTTVYQPLRRDPHITLYLDERKSEDREALEYIRSHNQRYVRVPAEGGPAARYGLFGRYEGIDEIKTLVDRLVEKEATSRRELTKLL